MGDGRRKLNNPERKFEWFKEAEGSILLDMSNVQRARALSPVTEEMRAKQEQCVEKSSIFCYKRDESNAQRLRILLYIMENIRVMCKGMELYPISKKR